MRVTQNHGWFASASAAAAAQPCEGSVVELVIVVVPSAAREAMPAKLPAFGHRNQIFNAHKLYLADKHEDYETAGLWGVRLMFTTETPHECVAVTQSYLGLTDYRPNGLTRGLYYRGVE